MPWTDGRLLLQRQVHLLLSSTRRPVIRPWSRWMVYEHTNLLVYKLVNSNKSVGKIHFLQQSYSMSFVQLDILNVVVYSITVTWGDLQLIYNHCRSSIWVIRVDLTLPVVVKHWKICIPGWFGMLRSLSFSRSSLASSTNNLIGHII